MNKTYRTLLLFSLPVLFVGNLLHASGWEFGLRAGVTRSKAAISRDLPFLTVKPNDEISASSFLTFFFSGDGFGIQPEIGYSVKGFAVMENDREEEISTKYKISYIEIPILLAYRFPLKGSLKPGLVFGPYFGFAQKVREVQTAFGNTERRELDDNLAKTDIGLVFGGNLQYRLGSVSILLSARYSLGFVNISKNIMDVSYDFEDDDTIKNRALTVSLGIAFAPSASR